MTKRSALLQASPTRRRNAATSRGTTTCASFRQGIVAALLQRGFRAPTEEALCELIASLDEEECGNIRFASLSGILIGGNGAAEGSTKYRGISLSSMGGSKEKRGRSVGQRPTPEPLEGTKIYGHLDDALSQVCVVHRARVEEEESDLVPSQSSGGAAETADSVTRNIVRKRRSELRLCSLTPTGRMVSIFDVVGTPKEDMSVEFVANVPMQTPDRLKCLLSCGDTGLTAVATEGNDILLFIGSSNWDSNVSLKKPERFQIRYKVTNLTYSPSTMGWFSGVLPTPSATSGFSTQTKDVLMFGGERGEISLFVW